MSAISCRIKDCKEKRYFNSSLCKSHYYEHLDELRSKPKKKNKPTEQQLVEKQRKKCVQLAKDISKKKDDYKCIYCGVGKPQRQVHSHHFFHEGMFKSMSADPDNLITLCASHHQGGQWMKSNNGFNFHNSPRESTEWFMEYYPERYTSLLERSKQYTNLNMDYWLKKYEQLKKLETNQ